MLRRIFGPKRDEVTGEWRKLHNEELTDLYPSPTIIRKMKSGRMRDWRACSKYGGGERCIHDLAGKPEGKGPLGRLKSRWEDNIMVDLREVEWGEGVHGLDSCGSGALLCTYPADCPPVGYAQPFSLMHRFPVCVQPWL